MVLLTTIVIVIVLAIINEISCQPPNFDFDHLFKRKTYIKGAVFLFNPLKNCSGTIIHRWWVLTAAQCVHGLGDDVQVRVIAGGGFIPGRLLDGTREPPRHFQIRLPAEIHVHHSYQEGVLSKFDLALIKVDKPFELTDRVGVIGLSAVPWPIDANFSRRCVSWGFGDVQPGPVTRRTDVFFKSWNSTAMHNRQPTACRCTERFQRRRLVCLRQVDGVNLCDGDAGSSLLCPASDAAPGELAIFGVAHMTMYKYMCGFERPPGPGCQALPVDNVYMYTCPFNNWIAYRVPDVPMTPLTCKAPSLHTLSLTVLFALAISNALFNIDCSQSYLTYF